MPGAAKPCFLPRKVTFSNIRIPQRTHTHTTHTHSRELQGPSTHRRQRRHLRRDLSHTHVTHTATHGWWRSFLAQAYADAQAASAAPLPRVGLRRAASSWSGAPHSSFLSFSIGGLCLLKTNNRFCVRHISHLRLILYSTTRLYCSPAPCLSEPVSSSTVTSPVF